MHQQLENVAGVLLSLGAMWSCVTTRIFPPSPVGGRLLLNAAGWNRYCFNMKLALFTMDLSLIVSCFFKKTTFIQSWYLFFHIILLKCNYLEK